MNKNVILTRSLIGAVLILVVAFMISGKLADQAAPPAKNGAHLIKGVVVTQANPTNTPFRLPVYGKIAAYERIELYAEVGGVLENTHPAFLEGNSFSKGQTLLKMENSEAMATTMSMRSNYINTLTQVLPDLKLDYPDLFEEWQNYLVSIDVDQNTPAPPTVSNPQAKIFLTSKGVFSAYHSLKSSEERLSKYHIRAPFDGVVTASNIRPGTLVRIGQPMGTFINPTEYELEISLSLQYLPLLEVGNVVLLHSPDIEGEWKATINRINKGIDASSQTVKAYLRLRGSNLREGMYLNGVLEGVELENVIAIPRRLIFDNNNIWTVVDSTLMKTPITVVEYSGDTALIRGLDNKELYTTEPVPGGFSGMPVTYSEEL